MAIPDIMPVQTKPYRSDGRIRKEVALRAYEVYRHLYGEQEALINDGCRGGFGTNELIAFLYAMTFSRDKWREKVDEALEGMKL